MTGEVTLQGRVLPIGGLKQKVLAAHAAGLTDVILPERNRADLDDVPEDVREAMTFHPVMTIGEALEVALEPARAEADHGLTRQLPPQHARASCLPRRLARPRTSHHPAGGGLFPSLRPSPAMRHPATKRRKAPATGAFRASRALTRGARGGGIGTTTPQPSRSTAASIWEARPVVPLGTASR